MPAPANSCNTISPLLSAFHDDELNPEEKKLAAAHLEMCRNCRQELETIAQLALTLKQAPQRMLTRDLIGELQFRPKKPIKLFNADFFAGSAKWMPALAAVLILALVYAGLNSKQNQQPAKIASGQISSQSATPRPTSSTLTEQEKIAVLPPGTTGQRQSANAGKQTSKEMSPSYGTIVQNPTGENQTRKNQTGQKAVAPPREPVLPGSIDNTAAEPFVVASVPDEAENSMPDILGIATDEDGLYELKI